MTSRRGLFALTAAAAAGATLTACNRGGDGEGAGERVMLAVSTQTNPFFVQLVEGAQAEAEAQGLTLDIQDALPTTPPPQADQLANAITQGISLVIVNPHRLRRGRHVRRVADDSGIPVIAVGPQRHLR